MILLLYHLDSTYLCKIRIENCFKTELVRSKIKVSRPRLLPEQVLVIEYSDNLLRTIKQELSVRSCIPSSNWCRCGLSRFLADHIWQTSVRWLLTLCLCQLLPLLGRVLILVLLLVLIQMKVVSWRCRLLLWSLHFVARDCLLKLTIISFILKN